MKKLLSLAFVLTMVFALAIPALAAPSGFIGGTIVTIDKRGYDGFEGTEITANNSSTIFDNFSIVADNKTLNAWYIDVTDDISGTLEVAYKIGNAYYVVTFDIDGAGKYWIADSRGSNGANMVKIGAFNATPIHTHDYIPEVTPPTCTEEGYTTYTCKCGATYKEVIPAPGHNWENGRYNYYLPTCEEDGYGRRQCFNCDEMRTEPDEGSALDHDWNDGVVTTPATCEETGVMTFTCKRDGCGKTYTEVIPALGYTYFLGIYASGSVWAEYWFDNAIAIGGTWVKSDFDWEGFRFFAICDDLYGNELACDIHVPLIVGNSNVSGDYWGWDGNKYHVELEIEWDGANNISVTLITFNIVE